MNKSLARVLGLIVCIAMLVVPFAGCTTAAPTPAPATSAPAAAATATPVPTPPPGPDISKAVELQCYMVGDAPKDLQMVVDKVNEMTKKDLNCTVVWNFTSWTDYNQKYNMLLSSGQPIDLIYSATWLDFWKLAKAGAFKPLEELLPKYAPELNKHEGEQVLMQATVNGHLMTIPDTYKEYITNGITYREDLRAKYSLPKPDSLANIEAYLLGIKTNDPDQKELTLEGPVLGPVVRSFTAMEALTLRTPNNYTMMLDYGMQADYAKPSEITAYWGSQQFTDDMKLFKKWADEGFWSKSALSQQADVNAFDNGRIVMVMSGENPIKYSQHMLKIKKDHPDWQVGYVNFATVDGVAVAVHPCQNGFAEPVSCPNPERAMMYLNKLIMDKTYNQLQEYGILGTHYTVDANGYYVGGGANAGFPREGMNGWGYRNEDYMLYDSTFDAVKTLNAQLDPYRKMNIVDGFAEDYTAYQSQRAALGSVMTQYLAPLEAGLVPDVDAAVKTFMDQANAAGLADMQQQYVTQWKAYIASLKLS
jgi:putative aldouronate transport system substrate-binding protein